MDDVVKALNILVRRGDTSTAEQLLDAYGAGVEELRRLANERNYFDAEQFINRYLPGPREQRLLNVLDNDRETLLTLLRERRRWSTWSDAKRATLPDPKHDRRWLRPALRKAQQCNDQATIKFLVEHVDGARDVWLSLTRANRCNVNDVVCEVINSDATPRLVRAIQAGDRQRVDELLSTEQRYDAHLLLVAAASAQQNELFKLLAARFGAVETGR